MYYTWNADGMPRTINLLSASYRRTLVDHWFSFSVTSWDNQKRFKPPKCGMRVIANLLTSSDTPCSGGIPPQPVERTWRWSNELSHSHRLSFNITKGLKYHRIQRCAAFCTKYRSDDLLKWNSVELLHFKDRLTRSNIKVDFIKR